MKKKFSVQEYARKKLMESKRKNSKIDELYWLIVIMDRRIADLEIKKWWQFWK